MPHPALFEKVADHIIALEQLDHLKPQELANTGTFEKAGFSHPRLSEKVARHIVTLEHLNEFDPQAFSNSTGICKSSSFTSCSL